MAEEKIVVGLIVGSVSEPSLNRRLGNALAVLAPRVGLELRDIPIGGLPFYGTQYDHDYPPEGLALKEALAEVEGLIIVTPEYNRSIPGVLKNAIDWASRPPGRSSLDRLPTGVIGMSGGVISTAVAQAHLKSILASQGAPLVGRPEAYIRNSEGLIDDDGVISVPATEDFLVGWLGGVRELVDRWR
jgi:chromate reductase, NAD(P)H dehydrogenase (quinone)